MNRMEKINEVFKRELGALLLMGQISDPRVSSVTITYVDISKDLSWAHIGFSVLNDGPAAVKAALNGLSSASGRIRRLLAEKVQLRYMPRLKFVYDSSVLDNFRMSVTLDAIREERESRLNAGNGDDTPPITETGEGLS